MPNEHDNLSALAAEGKPLGLKPTVAPLVSARLKPCPSRSCQGKTKSPGFRRGLSRTEPALSKVEGNVRGGSKINSFRDAVSDAGRHWNPEVLVLECLDHQEDPQNQADQSHQHSDHA